MRGLRAGCIWETGEKIRVFSKKSAEEQAKYLGIPLISEMPINLNLVESMEKGEAEKFVSQYEEYNKLLDSFKRLCK